MAKKQKNKFGTIDSLILNILYNEYQLGNEDFVDLSESLDQVSEKDLNESVSYLRSQGFVNMFSNQEGQKEIFAKITSKGIKRISGNSRNNKNGEDKNLRSVMADISSFISDGKVIISTVVIVFLSVFGWWLDLHKNVLQGSILEMFTGKPTAEDTIKDSIFNVDESTEIVPLGQVDGKYFFQVSKGDDDEAEYFFFELKHDEESDEWEIIGVEKLH